MLDPLGEHRAWGRWHKERGIARAIPHGRGQELPLPPLLSLERARSVERLNALVSFLTFLLIKLDCGLYDLEAELLPIT